MFAIQNISETVQRTFLSVFKSIRNLEIQLLISSNIPIHVTSVSRRRRGAMVVNK